MPDWREAFEEALSREAGPLERPNRTPGWDEYMRARVLRPSGPMPAREGLQAWVLKAVRLWRSPDAASAWRPDGLPDDAGLVVLPGVRLRPGSAYRRNMSSAERCWWLLRALAPAFDLRREAGVIGDKRARITSDFERLGAAYAAAWSPLRAYPDGMRVPPGLHSRLYELAFDGDRPDDWGIGSWAVLHLHIVACAGAYAAIVDPIVKDAPLPSVEALEAEARAAIRYIGKPPGDEDSPSRIADRLAARTIRAA